MLLYIYIYVICIHIYILYSCINTFTFGVSFFDPLPWPLVCEDSGLPTRHAELSINTHILLSCEARATCPRFLEILATRLLSIDPPGSSSRKLRKVGNYSQIGNLISLWTSGSSFTACQLVSIFILKPFCAEPGWAPDIQVAFPFGKAQHLLSESRAESMGSKKWSASPSGFIHQEWIKLGGASSEHFPAGYGQWGGRVGPLPAISWFINTFNCRIP